MPLAPRPRGDGLLTMAGVLALIQVGGSFLAARGQPDREPLDAVAVALLLVGPASVAVAGRRWPLVPVAAAGGAACAFIGFGYPFGPVFAGAAVAVFLAIQAGHRRGVLLLAPPLVAGFVVAGAADHHHDLSPWVHVLIVVGWLIAVIAVSELVRSRREQAAARRRDEQAARERELADTRLRLAQELHDVLAHNISLIHVQSSVALHLLDQQPQRAGEALANVKRASAEALDELRAALDLLRTGDRPHAPSPRVADLPDLAERVRAGGLDVTLDLGGVDREPLPGAVELAAYRIVQEALTNVTRHSSARAAAVRLSRTANELRVEVVDDGTHATVPGPESAGRGLIGMRERAASLGGTLTAEVTGTGGFRVHARLPLRAHA